MMIESQAVHGELVRELLYRRDLALARHRAALSHELGVTDGEMLAIIHVSRQSELTAARLGVLLELSSGGVTALVQRLERAGHIMRRPHPRDRRSSVLLLTQATAELLRRADVALVDGLEEMAAELDDREQAAVARFLTGITELSEGLAQASSDSGSDAVKPYRPVPSLWA